MLNSDKEFLFVLGWDDFFESHAANFASELLIPARVICEERNLYRVQSGLEKTTWSSVSGRLHFTAKSRADLPAVGDWVLIKPNTGDKAVIHHILPRKSVLSRKQSGSSSSMQILATNVDYVFIATSANHDLNLQRIERYMTIAYQSGSEPIILLTKADICSTEISNLTAEVQERFPNVKVYALSKNYFSEAQFFQDYLKPGATSVVVGSSGVGKSTLINFVIGKDQIKTQDIRQSDSKGRHTTTARSLYISKWKGLIIDTPGMRELQLLEHEDGVKSQFADIEEITSECRFKDCQHDTEPDCAIKEALNNNLLSEKRWRNYQKLEAEVRHGLLRQDKMLRSEERKVWKKRSIEIRKIKNSRNGVK